jgi:hypothetical protein
MIIRGNIPKTLHIGCFFAWRLFKARKTKSILLAKRFIETSFGLWLQLNTPQKAAPTTNFFTYHSYHRFSVIQLFRVNQQAIVETIL